MINLFRIMLFCLLLLPLEIMAQEGVTYRIQGNYIHATVDLDQPDAVVDSIVKTFGYDSLSGIENQLPTRGWVFTDRSYSSLHFTLDKKNETKALPNAYTFGDVKKLDVYNQTQAIYGVNAFKETSVYRRGNEVVFTLEGFSNANQVYLSGTFNGWSTLATPMKRTGNGWEISLPLHAGKHVYKFIVDGQWMEDPQNRSRENDGNSGKNSVYYVTNYTFELHDFTDAKKVYVAGSFNNWEPIKMQYDDQSKKWILPMYLREGTYAYKFRVDGEWILDPSNEVVRPDGMGNENNFTSVGDTIFFQLPRHYDAQRVTVAGDFNGWNFDELALYRSLEGWILPYVLPAGNFEYKFRVDNTYMLDPNNPVRNGENDYLNNVLSIEPNQTFVLRGYSEANVVLLSGSFNDWSTSGYTMQKVDGEWRIRIFLPQGKTLYKFLVDGVWMIDPSNKLWENNEFDSKNSIIWVEP